MTGLTQGPGSSAGSPVAGTGLDPRAALLSTLVFVGFVASFPRYGLAPLAPLAVAAALAAVATRVSPGLLFRRLAVAAPFAVAVGLANPFLDRRPYLELWGASISGGWVSLATLAFKVLLCLTAAVVLAAAVPPGRLAWALRGLGAPRALVVQVDLLVRYLGVLGAEAAGMRRARELRAFGARRARGPRIAAAMLGSLLHRSLDRSERVHRAMLARGFDGEIRVLARSRWRLADTAWLAGVLALCAAARFLPLVDWVGRAARG